MAARTTRRSRTPGMADVTDRRSLVEGYISLGHLGFTRHMIGEVTAACRVEECGGEERVVVAITEHGIANIGASDGTRWNVADGGGFLVHEFPTLHDAVGALHNPRTRAAMRRYADHVAEISDFPLVPNALPLT